MVTSTRVEHASPTAAVELRRLEVLIDRIPERLKRESAANRTRIVGDLCGQLALVVPYLEPCYRESVASSLVCVALALRESSESWTRVADGLSALGSWFYAWRERLQETTAKPRAKDLVALFHDLNRMLFFTSVLGAEMIVRGSGSPGAVPDRALVTAGEQYDRFLTDYERLCWKILDRLGLDEPGPQREPRPRFARIIRPAKFPVR